LNGRQRTLFAEALERRVAEAREGGSGATTKTITEASKAGNAGVLLGLAAHGKAVVMYLPKGGDARAALHLVENVDTLELGELGVYCALKDDVTMKANRLGAPFETANVSARDVFTQADAQPFETSGKSKAKPKATPAAREERAQPRVLILPLTAAVEDPDGYGFMTATDRSVQEAAPDLADMFRQWKEAEGRRIEDGGTALSFARATTGVEQTLCLAAATHATVNMTPPMTQDTPSTGGSGSGRRDEDRERQAQETITSMMMALCEAAKALTAASKAGSAAAAPAAAAAAEEIATPAVEQLNLAINADLLSRAMLRSLAVGNSAPNSSYVKSTTPTELSQISRYAALTTTPRATPMGLAATASHARGMLQEAYETIRGATVQHMIGGGAEDEEWSGTATFFGDKNTVSASVLLAKWLARPLSSWGTQDLSLHKFLPVTNAEFAKYMQAATLCDAESARGMTASTKHEAAHAAMVDPVRPIMDILTLLEAMEYMILWLWMTWGQYNQVVVHLLNCRQLVFDNALELNRFVGAGDKTVVPKIVAAFEKVPRHALLEALSGKTFVLREEVQAAFAVAITSIRALEGQHLPSGPVAGGARGTDDGGGDASNIDFRAFSTTQGRRPDLFIHSQKWKDSGKGNLNYINPAYYNKLNILFGAGPRTCMGHLMGSCKADQPNAAASCKSGGYTLAHKKYSDQERAAAGAAFEADPFVTSK